ncbi:MAG: HAD hydrolase-like protein [Oscillospiraceae bacterium]
MRECLHALKAAGKRMYVATSKLESMARQVLTHFDLMQYLTAYAAGSPTTGGREEGQRRAPRCAGRCGVFRRHLSGDREYDIYGGHAAGIQTVGVLYGYGSREELERPVRTRLRKRRRRCWRFAVIFR